MTQNTKTPHKKTELKQTLTRKKQIQSPKNPQILTLIAWKKRQRHINVYSQKSKNMKKLRNLPCCYRLNLLLAKWADGIWDGCLFQLDR